MLFWALQVSPRNGSIISINGYFPMSRRNDHISFATNASTSSRVVFIRVKLPPPSSFSVFLISSWKVMIRERNYSVISTYSNLYRFSIPTVSNAATTEPISSVSIWIACISILISTNIHRYTRRKVSWLTIMWTTVRRNGHHWLSMMFSKMLWHQNSPYPSFRTMILSVTKVSFRWASTWWISRGSYSLSNNRGEVRQEHASSHRLFPTWVQCPRHQDPNIMSLMKHRWKNEVHPKKIDPSSWNARRTV